MYSREWMALAKVLVLSTAAWPWLQGCDSAAARRRQLGSGNPLDRAQAIVRVSEARDVGAVHKLVDLLEDPDDAVRMYAILALRRLCGEDFGYRYYERAVVRAAAVQRWREALRAGDVVLQPAMRTDATDESGPESKEAAAGGTGMP